MVENRWKSLLKKSGSPLKRIREYSKLYHPNELNPDV